MWSLRNVFSALAPRLAFVNPSASVASVGWRAVLYRRPMFSCSMYGSSAVNADLHSAADELIRDEG